MYGSCFNALSYLSRPLAAEIAFNTFCKVRKGRVLPHQANFLEKARKGRETINGHEVQTYQWEGSRDTVLLVHGWESNSFRWRNLIQQLQGHNFDILAFDAPGHGNSTGKLLPVPLYAECIRHMVQKHRPRYVVAHSIGGMSLLYSQYRYPETYVEKIVTIGSPSEFREITGYFQQLLNLNPRVMEGMDLLFKERFGYHFHEFSTSRFARSIPKKGLLFHDTLDVAAPFHASEQVHAHWEDSILVATEGLGHSMHQEEVNNRIVTFLNS